MRSKWKQVLIAHARKPLANKLGEVSGFIRYSLGRAVGVVHNYNHLLEEALFSGLFKCFIVERVLVKTWIGKLNYVRLSVSG